MVQDNSQIVHKLQISARWLVRWILRAKLCKLDNSQFCAQDNSQFCTQLRVVLNSVSRFNNQSSLCQTGTLGQDRKICCGVWDIVVVMVLRLHL